MRLPEDGAGRVARPRIELLHSLAVKDRTPFPSGILEDRNRDGLTDYLNAKIYVAEDASADELAAAANIAARLAFETLSLDLPIGCRIGEFNDIDSTVAVVVGRAALRWTRGDAGVVETREGSRKVVAIGSSRDADRWARSLAGPDYRDAEAAPGPPPDPDANIASLADLFTARGLLGASPGAFLPDGTRTVLSIGSQTSSPAVIDLAARIALETTGLTLPLAVASVAAGSDALRGHPVLVGISHPRILELGAAGRLHLGLAAGEGRIELVEDPSGTGGCLLAVFGGDAGGESAALGFLARRLPFAREYGKGNLELRQIESDLGDFFSLRSAEGQLAAGLFRARRMLEQLDDEARPTARIRIWTGGVGDPLRDYARDAFGDREVVVGDAGVISPEPIFEDVFAIEWEVDRARARFREEVLPAVRAGSRVDLEVRLSEGRETRRQLGREFRRALLEGGAAPRHTRVRVLSAFKQGYCWIDEILKPRLREAAQVTVHVRELDPGSPHSIDPKARWLQELYPIDEILARDCGLPVEGTTFRWAASGPTYRVVARNASGEVFLEESFEAAFRDRLLFARFPDYATARVSTGWIRAEVDAVLRLDERMPTDPETFWDAFETRGLDRLHDYLVTLYQGAPDPAQAPHFGAFEVDVEMSEPDYRIGIDEERFSTIEALHEDIYFQTLLFLDLVGLQYGDAPLPYAGRIIPRVRPSRPGAGPWVRLRLTGKRAHGPGVALEFASGGQAASWRDALLPRETGRPRIRSAAVRHGSRDVSLGVMLATSPEPDCGEGVEGEAASMLAALAGFRERGLGRGVLSYKGVERLDIRLGFGPACPEASVEQVADAAWEPPRLGAVRRTRHPIVPTKMPLGSAGAAKVISGLAAFPEVRPFYAGRSFLGKAIWAMDVTSETAGRYISQARLSVTKPVLFVTGRQHGNEVSGTTHILKLVESLVSQERGRLLLEKVNFIVHPVTNPDGADLADELGRSTPDFMLHAGYFGCLGVDVTRDQWADHPLYPESRIRRDLWEMWLPDVVLDPHGYPSHEWIQLFGGYSAWFRSRERIHRDWWIPRGAFMPAFRFVEDPRYPHHEATACAIRDTVAQALADAMGTENERMYRRYRKYACPDGVPAPWSVSRGLWICPAEPAQGAKETTGWDFAMRRPDVTAFQCTIELPDETARGERLGRLVEAGLEASLACARFLAEASFEVRKLRAVAPGRTTFLVERARPVLPREVPT